MEPVFKYICHFALVAEKLGIASAGAGTTVRVCMGLSLMTIQSDRLVLHCQGACPKTCLITPGFKSIARVPLSTRERNNVLTYVSNTV